MDRIDIAAEVMGRQTFSDFKSSFHLNKFACRNPTDRVS